MDALALAQGRRLAGAELRDEIKALSKAEGAARVARLLLDPDEIVGSIRIDQFLTSIRRLGGEASNKMLCQADVYGGKRVREITPLRREQLARSVVAWSQRWSGDGER